MRSASMRGVMRVARVTTSVDRLGAGPDRGVLGELEDPGAVHRAVAGLGPGRGTTAEALL